MSELPRGWVQTTLDEITAPIRESVTPAESEDRPYLGLEHVEAHSTRIVGTSDASKMKSAALVIRPGDTLYGRLRPYLNKVCVPDFKGLASAEFIVFRPRSWLAPRFLLYLLNRRSFAAFANSLNEGDRPRVKWDQLSSHPVALPPLAEQRRIVAAIEEHFSRLDAAEESLRRAQTRLIAFKASGLHRELRGDWPTVALGDLAKLITKGTTPTSVGHRFATSGVLFVKAESLRRGVVDHERCAFITDATHQFLARSQLAENDVLITIAGTLGRTGVVRAKDLPANTNQAVSLTRVRDVSIVPWLLAWLNGPQAQMYLTTGGRGIGLQNLNLRQIAELPVPIPPEDDQRRVVAEVERQLSLVDALAAATAAALKRSAALRRSILERAFTGNLVHQDPTDEPASVLLERTREERAATVAPRRSRRTRAPE